MNLYVLDTDHVTLHQRGDPRVTARLQACNPDVLAITVVTVEEQLRGRLAQIKRAKADVLVSYRELAATVNYFCDLRILAFDERAQRHFERLRVQKVRVGTLDLRIAAIVLSQNAILVTRNTRDFRLVPHLKLEDWSE